PFQVHLIGLNLKKQEVAEACEKIYNDLNTQKIDVLFDDRDAAAGFKFNDADLLGMPIQIVVGEKKLKENMCEVKIRKTGERFDVGLGELMKKVNEVLEIKTKAKAKKWAKEEENKLRELIGNFTENEIAQKLGRSIHSIRMKAIRLNLTRVNKH